MGVFSSTRTREFPLSAHGGVTLTRRHSGNFDDECHPCIIAKQEQGDGLLLKCNCLNPSGIPQYTFIGMGPGGELLRQLANFKDANTKHSGSSIDCEGSRRTTHLRRSDWQQVSQLFDVIVDHAHIYLHSVGRRRYRETFEIHTLQADVDETQSAEL